MNLSTTIETLAELILPHLALGIRPLFGVHAMDYYHADTRRRFHIRACAQSVPRFTVGEYLPTALRASGVAPPVPWPDEQPTLDPRVSAIELAVGPNDFLAQLDEVGIDALSFVAFSLQPAVVPADSLRACAYAIAAALHANVWLRPGPMPEA